MKLHQQVPRRWAIAKLATKHLAIRALQERLAQPGNSRGGMLAVAADIVKSLSQHGRVPTAAQSSFVLKYGLFYCRCGAVASRVVSFRGFCDKHRENAREALKADSWSLRLDSRGEEISEQQTVRDKRDVAKWKDKGSKLSIRRML